MISMTMRVRRHVGAASRPSRRHLAFIALVGAVAVAGCQPGDSLIGSTWEWTAWQEVDPAHEAETPDPGDYTIEFLTDGTVNVNADCNNLSGTYSVGVPLDLTIHLAATTMGECGAASLAGTYLELLGRVASYSTGGGALQLELADDAGEMRFKIPSS